MKRKRLIIACSVVLLCSLATIPASRAYSGQPGQQNQKQGRILFLQDPHFTGNDVMDLQQRLRVLGYYKGNLNGVYDQVTARAVALAQESLDLHPDGTVNLYTLQALVTATDQKLLGDKIPAVPERVSVIIDMDQLTLTLFDGGEPCKQYPVAMGKYESPTPVGNWEIVSKYMNPPGVMGTRWLGLNIPYGQYGVHGTNNPGSIGSFASQGCIRMYNTHVEEVYPAVTVGTSVTIVGTPFGAPGVPPTQLKYGAQGPGVLEIQRSLKRLGYLKWNPDGFWGEGTEKAVKKFREDRGLEGPVRMDDKAYELLGY